MMTEEHLIAHAKALLNRDQIPFVEPGRIGRKEKDRSEVIFLIPEALDPNVVVDPEDVRVWVFHDTGNAEFILQM
jgi:hypothetical protein